MSYGIVSEYKSKMEKVVVQSACFGLMSYTDDMTPEEYKVYKERRKKVYQQRFYATLTEDEVKQRNIDKTRKVLNDLRQKWFKIKCSGQCMDFNCSACERLRKPLQAEIRLKEQQLLT